jgi:hypothetical protein
MAMLIDGKSGLIGFAVFMFFLFVLPMFMAVLTIVVTHLDRWSSCVRVRGAGVFTAHVLLSFGCYTPCGCDRQAMVFKSDEVDDTYTNHDTIHHDTWRY